MTDILLKVNELLTAAVLVVSFSLVIYVAIYNWRNSVARAICLLLTSVVIVYGGDILLGRTHLPITIQFLLRAQWLGIALVPAAYLHLSSALRKASHENGKTPTRRLIMWLGYASSIVVFLLALHTDLIIRGGISSDMLAQFGPGPYFWLYVVFFVGSILITLRTIMQAHRDVLTPTLRRRMSYLQATFIAPGLGVFPYLVVSEGSLPFSHTVMLFVLAIVNVGVTGMLTVMAYSAGFQGVRVPDRLIKQDFVRWGLYGPVVGVTIILCLQIVPWLERKLGLPGETLITFVVMIMTVLMPILISRVRPYLYALVYMQDQEEIDYVRGLPRNILTSSDLRQLLENTLIAVCGALNVETGFVAGPGKGGFTVKAVCGSRRSVKRFVSEHPLHEVMPRMENMRGVSSTSQVQSDEFLTIDGFWLLPLHSPDGIFLGTLGVVRSADAIRQNGAMMHEAQHLIHILTHQIELAMTTVQMQHRIFDTLRTLGPEVESLQKLNAQLEQATPVSLSSLETDVSLDPKFSQLVKDALTHYWGGPKLSDSPLLELRSVRRLIQEEGGSATRALQGVLRQAINNIRPDEQLDPSAQEWLLYNILELRFLQGKRIRDVANRLAMSESDYYRKQRVAIEEVARQLTLMEDSEKTKV